MTLPAPLTLILPLIVTAIAGLLSHDRAPSWLNAIIAFIILAASAVAWSLLDQKLTGNLVTDIALIAAYCAALMASPVLAPLYQWLKLNTPSPLSGIAKPIVVDASPVTAQGTISSAGTIRTPQPLNLPDRTFSPAASLPSNGFTRQTSLPGTGGAVPPQTPDTQNG